MTEAIDSDEVLRMLNRHYLPPGRPPAGCFLPELVSPDGKRRADLIWYGTTTSAGGLLIGHEIKVTRTDVLAELDDATKADAWLRYCNRWWLVLSDPDLVKGLDIPETWGIMAPPSGRRTRSMSVLREAPKLKPEAQDEAFRRIVHRLNWRLGEVDREKVYYQDQARRDREELVKEQSRKPAEFKRTPTALSEFIMEVSRILGGAHGNDDLTGKPTLGNYPLRITPEQCAAALRDLGEVERIRDGLDRQRGYARRQLEQIHRNIDHILTEDGKHARS